MKPCAHCIKSSRKKLHILIRRIADSLGSIKGMVVLMAAGNPSEKIENLLNLSLSATEEEMMKSPILRDGIVEREEEPIWEVIVKYHGDISGLASEIVLVEELINGYGIVTLPESFIEPLAAMEEIEYVEKPKSLYPSDYEGNLASCVTQVTVGEPFLTGEGVIVGLIDSGERVVIMSSG